MSIITRRPLNPGSRGQQFVRVPGLEKSGTLGKQFIVSKGKRCSGRNVYGKITVRHRGGGAKALYRLVDFKRDLHDVEGRVDSFHYDPSRNVSLALIVYKNGQKRLILRPESLSVGDIVSSGPLVEAKVGNALPLEQIPDGFIVHNVELLPGHGGVMVRSAGAFAQIVSKEGGRALLKVPSGELRFVNLKCYATVGTLSNAEFKNATLGKAGRSRHRGIRPSVRGIAMNPVDHPRGGGEGRSKSGTQPCSPWGKMKPGVRTRRERRKGVVFRRRK